MHWIQRYILKELAVADSRRYSELKPDEVEGNLFQYHSKDLQKQGLIDRSEGGYALTAKGKAFVANLSLTRNMSRRIQPRIITMIMAKNDQAQWLLFKWKRQPYRGKVSFPSGRLGFGEDLHEAAADQLRFKTGYEAELVYLGTIMLKNETDHILAQAFIATNLTGIHGSDGLTGKSFWAGLDDIPLEHRLTGLAEIINWVNDTERKALLELAQ
jgi:ADP-ribose pyrophosphatase YjhB (NUDIX family)